MILKDEARDFYFESFAEKEKTVVFSHGRLELLGNHTDHNRGLVLASGVDLGITAAIGKNEDGYVCVASKGFRPFEFDVADLEYRKEEEGTTAGLVRGILFKMKELGFEVGGFNLAAVSDIPSGSGVSSSACFESLIVKAVSLLFNEDGVGPAQMAIIGQFAENEYFGKPCGLLDQIGTSFGGVTYVDFKEEAPEVELLSFPFALAIFLIDAGGSHDGLTHLYAEIPADMHSVARHMYGKENLREISREEYFAHIGFPCHSVSERAKMRATHFYEENIRVSRAREAIKRRDEGTFINEVNASGLSSQVNLANTMVPGRYQGSPQQVIDALRPYLGNAGAIRIMGGGFAGSVIAFVPVERSDAFKDKAEAIFGKRAVKEVHIVEDGPVEVE